MTDLVERLGKAANEIANAGHAGWGNTCVDAATEIERLQAENERLGADWAKAQYEIAKYRVRQELLEKVVEAASACITAWDDAKWPSPIPLRKALAALKEQVTPESSATVQHTYPYKSTSPDHSEQYSIGSLSAIRKDPQVDR